MLGVFAEVETNLRRERQMEGIARAKAAGVYKGRPKDTLMITRIDRLARSIESIKAKQVHELKAEGLGASEIAKRMGIGRASVYRALEV